MCPQNNHPAKIDPIELKPFKKAALMAKRKFVVVNQVVPDLKSGLDTMIVFQRGEPFDMIQMVSLTIFNLFNEENASMESMEYGI